MSVSLCEKFMHMQHHKTIEVLWQDSQLHVYIQPALACMRWPFKQETKYLLLENCTCMVLMW